MVFFTRHKNFKSKNYGFPLPPLEIVYNSSDTLVWDTIHFRNRHYGNFPTMPPHSSRVLWYFYPIWGSIWHQKFHAQKLLRAAATARNRL